MPPSQSPVETMPFCASKPGSARLTILFLFALLAFQGFFLAAHTGQTIDETFYNGSSWPLVRYNDYRFLGEHPPLVMQLGGLPLLALKPHFPIENPVRLEGREGLDLSRTGSLFLYGSGNNPYQILFAERSVIVLLMMVLAGAVYAWAHRLGGMAAGLTALTLFAFNPDILSHGSLFTTDLASACFFFLTLASYRDFLEDPRAASAVRTGLLLGAALLTKLNGVLLIPLLAGGGVHSLLDPESKTPRATDTPLMNRLLPVLLVILFVLSWRQPAARAASGALLLAALPLCPRRWHFGSAAGMYLALLWCVILLVTLQAVLGFHAGLLFRTAAVMVVLAVAVSSFALRLRQGIQSRISCILKAGCLLGVTAALMIPLLHLDFYKTLWSEGAFFHYLKTMHTALSHARSNHTVCLEGSYVTCDWKYYLAALPLKIPLLVLALALPGLLIILRSRLRLQDKALLILPPLFFLFVASFVNNVRIGIRHILPVYPFLFLWGGVAGAQFLKSVPARFYPAARVILVLGLALSALRTVSFFPHYLTYASELSGSTEKAATLLADSNLFWGQDNKALAQTVEHLGIPSVHVATLTANPDEWAYHGMHWISTSPAEWEVPLPGWYALDLFHYLQEQKRPSSWFYQRHPYLRIGKTFYLFRVPS